MTIRRSSIYETNPWEAQRNFMKTMNLNVCCAACAIPAAAMQEQKNAVSVHVPAVPGRHARKNRVDFPPLVRRKACVNINDVSTPDHRARRPDRRCGTTRAATLRALARGAMTPSVALVFRSAQ
jgi:hypothetical protein